MHLSEQSHEPRTPPRWKHGPIPVIGLIGGIGGGKSEVAALLSRTGRRVIDADAVGHELLTGPSVREPDRRAVRSGSRWSERVVEPVPSPGIDRRALGAIVFADPTARRA